MQKIRRFPIYAETKLQLNASNAARVNQPFCVSTCLLPVRLKKRLYAGNMLLVGVWVHEH